MIASPGWTILRDDSGDDFGSKKYVVVCSQNPDLVGKVACIAALPNEFLNDKNELLYAIRNENIACYE